MARIAALSLAALALCGCGDEDNDLVIDNAGGDTAVVHVDFKGAWGGEDDDFFEVPPGERRVVRYDAVGELEVFIRRKGDGLPLFSASYDQEDFDDDHGDIEILVAP
jgi:hypothetical protein